MAPVRSKDTFLRVRSIGIALSVGIACALAAAAASAGPTTLYASSTSTDTSGSCGMTAPCRIDHAIALANPGDVVVALPGTYSISYPVSVSAPITLTGAPGQPRPSLIGGASLSTDTISVSGGAVVRHLDIEAQARGRSALSIDGGVAEDLILSNSAQTGGGAALRAADSASGTTVRTVLAHAPTAAGYAVLLKDGASPGNVTLLNVTAVAESPSTAAIQDNVTTGSATVENTIATGSSTDLWSGSGAVPVNVSYSAFQPANSRGYVDRGGNVLAAPRFANAAAKDFHEAATSPTIDAGSANAALTATDLDGNPRIMGNAPDIGAYEYPAPVTGQAGPLGSTGADGPALQLPPASSPVPGVSVALRRASGTVRVKLPGHPRFLRLGRAASVPVGSIIDVTKGRVILTSAIDHTGRARSGTFTGGRFLVSQPAGDHPLTDLRLLGGSFARCASLPAAAGDERALARAARRRPRHHVVRQLWGSDSGGSFVTIGSTASAAVRGTVWLTQDRCEGTFVRVLRGAVLVHDDGLGRNVLVRRGHSYLARAHR